MSKPNFWRLKRKAKDKVDTTTHNHTKISQKTIASFFGAKSSSNLSEDGAGQTDLNSESCNKRVKLDDKCESVQKEKAPIKLSETGMLKLRSFSSTGGNSKESGLQECHTKNNTTKKSEGSFYNAEEKEEDDDAQVSDISSVASLVKSNLEMFKPKTHGIPKTISAESLPKFGKVKYTPLEQQVMDLWKQHTGVLLFVECGYKYRFFGKDAEIAAQELNIYAHMDHNFMTASIPVHRLHAHVNRLVQKGYKVGVVKQVETAALKASSDNKHAPFSRRLEHLFTCATLIGEDVDFIDQQNVQLDEGISAGHIFCFNETCTDPKVTNIVFVAVNPSTGECIYEQFTDNVSREELQKRIQIINPAEILYPMDLSSESERLLNHSDARLERLPLEWFETADALTRVTSYFASEIEGKHESSVLQKLTELPILALSCLAAVQQHLSEFGLHRVIRPESLQTLTFGNDSLHMDSSTIRNLQLFVSDAGTSHGSLFWALNHTKTKFGARLLHKWIAQPLRVKTTLEERQESIKELLGADQSLIVQLKALLASIPDLEKGLTTILHTKCSPLQFFTILDALCLMSSGLSSIMITLEQENTAPLLLKLLNSTVSLLDDVETYRDNINLTAAKEGDKTKLLKDFSAFPNVLSLMKDIENTIQSLDKLRPEIARKLSLLSAQYTCVSGQEYLIEVKNSNAKCVPANWRKISSTKQVSRYRPPAVDLLFGELQCQREKLRAECHRAWIDLLKDFSVQYFKHKKAVLNVASIDAFLSLAHVAQQEGYCRPRLLESEGAQITIKKGRHPVVPLLFPSAEQFVPNDTNLNSLEECCMVLSGPNMGGKSCYIRQVALIALMAHIGSYVPAEYAEISLLDSIFTRMGARDELFHGRSTLMVELEETSSILQKVSKRSLVLLDELGRGTGSCDGSAIACATLRHIVLEVQCVSLFVTHYPSVMDTVSELEGKAANYHMAFLLHDGDDEFLTFLYVVVKGAAERSYGINVARLANLNKHLLQRASLIAAKFEKQAKHRRDIRLSFIESWQR